jgi:hypothetical protein
MFHTRRGGTANTGPVDCIHRSPTHDTYAHACAYAYTYTYACAYAYACACACAYACARASASARMPRSTSAKLVLSGDRPMRTPLG